MKFWFRNIQLRLIRREFFYNKRILILILLENNWIKVNKLIVYNFYIEPWLRPPLKLLNSLNSSISSGKNVQYQDEVKTDLSEFFGSKDKDYYLESFQVLANRWLKTVEHEGLYFENRAVSCYFTILLDCMKTDKTFASSSIFNNSK